MTALRVALVVAATVFLLLATSCSVATAPTPIPTPSPAPKPAKSLPSAPTPIATSLLAQVKSISPAKPIGPGSFSGPRLAIDVEGVEFGDVPFEKVVAFSFNVQDVGGAPVVLGPAFIRVKEGC